VTGRKNEVLTYRAFASVPRDALLGRGDFIVKRRRVATTNEVWAAFFQSERTKDQASSDSGIRVSNASSATGDARIWVCRPSDVLPPFRFSGVWFSVQ
jgi:hypothetical protein